MPDRDDLCLCGHMAMNHWTSADGDHLCDEENGDPDCLCEAFRPATAERGEG